MYKIVTREQDGNLYNARDGQTKYVIGKRVMEKARDGHGGGFYVYADPDTLRAHPESVLAKRWIDGKTLVLLECECIGTPVVYHNGKKAYSILTPTRIVDEWVYQVSEDDGN